MVSATASSGGNDLRDRSSSSETTLSAPAAGGLFQLTLPNGSNDGPPSRLRCKDRRAPDVARDHVVMTCRAAGIELVWLDQYARTDGVEPSADSSATFT